MAKRAKVVKSPSDAAIGVATLSGFMLHFVLTMTTMIMMIPKTNEAMDAVSRLDADKRSACFKLNSPAGIQSIKIAKQAARKPTTAA